MSAGRRSMGRDRYLRRHWSGMRGHAKSMSSRSFMLGFVHAELLELIGKRASLLGGAFCLSLPKATVPLWRFSAASFPLQNFTAPIIGQLVSKRHRDNLRLRYGAYGRGESRTIKGKLLAIGVFAHIHSGLQPRGSLVAHAIVSAICQLPCGHFQPAFVPFSQVASGLSIGTSFLPSRDGLRTFRRVGSFFLVVALRWPALGGVIQKVGLEFCPACIPTAFCERRQTLHVLRERCFVG